MYIASRLPRGLSPWRPIVLWALQDRGLDSLLRRTVNTNTHTQNRSLNTNACNAGSSQACNRTLRPWRHQAEIDQSIADATPVALANDILSNCTGTAPDEGEYRTQFDLLLARDSLLNSLTVPSRAFLASRHQLRVKQPTHFCRVTPLRKASPLPTLALVQKQWQGNFWNRHGFTFLSQTSPLLNQSKKALNSPEVH